MQSELLDNGKREPLGRLDNSVVEEFSRVGVRVDCLDLHQHLIEVPDVGHDRQAIARVQGYAHMHRQLSRKTKIFPYYPAIVQGVVVYPTSKEYTCSVQLLRGVRVVLGKFTPEPEGAQTHIRH